MITHQQGNFLSIIPSSTLTIHSHECDAANEGPYEGGQGTPKEAHSGCTRYTCYFLFYFIFHSISLNFTQFNISPSSTQPLNMSKMCCLCLPSLTDTPPSLPTTAIPSPTCWTSKTCPPCTEYWRHTPCGMFWCPEHNLPPLSLISNTRICTMRVCSGCLGLLSPFPSCWTPKTTLWVVMSRGNPWVQQAIPLPLPLKTPTPHQG